MLLGDLLLARGLVTDADIEAGLARQEKLGGRIGENLIALGVITKKTLDEALHEQYELAKAILDGENLLTKAKRILGSSHPKTNRLRCRLAVALIAGGRPDEALGAAQAALAGHQEALGKDHPWTKDSAQAVADADVAIARAASLGEGSAAPVDNLDAARPVDIADRGDRVVPVDQVTKFFVAKRKPDGQKLRPVRRIIGVLAGHH